MARVIAQAVEMPIALGILKKLGDIQDAAQKAAGRCQESLDGEVQNFCNQTARYLGESLRRDLEDRQNRESFNYCLLNTCDFLQLVPRILDALVVSQNMGKRAVEALANAYADAFFEVAFAGLEFLRKAKHKQVKPEQMKKLQKEFIAEFENEQISRAVSSFKNKVIGKLERVSSEIKKLSDIIAGLTENIQKIENKIEKQRAYFEMCRKAKKPVSPEHIAECMRKSEQSFELRIKRMNCEAQLLHTKASNEMLEKLNSKLADLSGETGEGLAEKWSRLFGPEGEGGKFVEQARQECKKRLELLAEVKKAEIDRLEQGLMKLPAEWQAPLAAYIAKMREAQARIVLQNEYFDKVLIDLAKNTTAQLVQKLTQAQDLEQQQKKNTGTGSWYDTFWNWVDSFKNWVAEKISQWVPGIITGMCSVIISVGLSILAWLASCFMGVMEFVARLTKNWGNRTVTYIGEEFRYAGQKEAVAKELPESFFDSAQQAEIVNGMLQKTDPDSVPDGVKDKGVKDSLKNELKSEVKARAASVAGQRKNEVYKLAVALCKNALDGRRIGESVQRAEKDLTGKIVTALHEVTRTMDLYRKQFDSGEKGFFDFAKEMWDHTWSGDDITWPQIANYLNLLSSQLTLAARLAAAGLLVFVATTPLAVSIFALAEVVDIVAVAARILVCLAATMPCVNAFGCDLVALLAVAHAAMIEGKSDFPAPQAGLRPATSEYLSGDYKLDTFGQPVYR